MQLILVRHGQPLSERLESGIANPGLSDLGLWQAEQLSHWLSCEPIDAMTTSPKARASETIAPLAGELNMAPTVVTELDEIDRGASTYVPTELLPTEGGEYWDKILAEEWDEIGWDSPEVFAQRVSDAFAALIEQRPGDRVVVACHGGVIGRYLSEVFGVPGRFGVSIDYAAISRVDIDYSTAVPKRTVRSVNEVGHFDARRTEALGPFRGLEVPRH